MMKTALTLLPLFAVFAFTMLSYRMGPRRVRVLAKRIADPTWESYCAERAKRQNDFS